MRWWSLVWCLVVWSVLPVVGGIWAQSISAAPEEAISKVREAAALIAQKGDAALADIERKSGPWVWKDSYVAVCNGNQDVLVAHPVLPNRRGAT